MKIKLSILLSLLLLCLPITAFGQIVGKIEKIENFASKYVKPRDVYVWLPVDYNKKEKYAVLYLQDANDNLFEVMRKDWGDWQVDEVMTQLLKGGKIRKTIVVGISSKDGEYRHSEYYPQKSLQYLPKEKRTKIVKNLLAGNPQADNYLLFLTKELKPLIDKKYSTKSDRDNTFIGGSSMGGLISIYAISEYPDTFGGAACLSTHFMGATSPEDILDKLVPDSIKQYFSKNIPFPKSHKIYFAYGNTGFPEMFYKPYQLQIDEIMKRKGYTSQNWISKEFSGGEHNPSSWSKQIPEIMEFLLKK